MPQNSFTGKRVALALFFFSLLAVGLISFRDYGLSWDDPNNQLLGDCADGRLHGVPIKGCGSQHQVVHSPLLELTITELQHAFSLRDSRQQYFCRHLVVFLIFWAATIAFYRLCSYFFADIDCWPVPCWY